MGRVTFSLEDHAENELGKLDPDLFLFYEKGFI